LLKNLAQRRFEGIGFASENFAGISYDGGYLFVAQGLDRVEAGSFDSGVHAKEQSDAGGNRHG
jgi:hypothetical protein